MPVTIEKCRNGYVVTQNNKILSVFEDNETEWGHLESFNRLLYFITERFGMLGSKHDEKRIRINIENED
jgi:hypothetical protein